jgi:hypothetical protein
MHRLAEAAMQRYARNVRHDLRDLDPVTFASSVRTKASTSFASSIASLGVISAVDTALVIAAIASMASAGFRKLGRVKLTVAPDSGSARGCR